MWVGARTASNNLKETVLSVLAWFRAYSETNLIKQGENVTGSITVLGISPKQYSAQFEMYLFA